MWVKNVHSKPQCSQRMKKQKQSKVAKAELRAGGGLHGPKKPGWSAGGMEKQPGNVKTSMNKEEQ